MNNQWHKITYNKGKVVYWVDGHSFENTSQGSRDGKTKAEEYCYEKLINSNEIIKFDSRTERDRYEYLLQLQKNGKISNLGHHFTIRIQNEFTNCNGDLIPALNYEADFIYFDEVAKKRIVEDVKGSEYFIDERFLTIKQVFDFLKLKSGLYIKVVLKRNNEWIEWRIGEAKKQQKLIKKQRETISKLKKQTYEEILIKRKIERYKARYSELKAKEKLTASERGRLNIITEYLKEKGVLL